MRQVRIQWGDAAILALFNTDIPFGWWWLRPLMAACTVAVPLVLWIAPVVTVFALSELRCVRGCWLATFVRSFIRSFAHFPSPEGGSYPTTPTTRTPRCA